MVVSVFVFDFTDAMSSSAYSGHHAAISKHFL